MKPLHIACPTCKREIEWSAANSWRPFCSERCKLVDLGAWLAEKHAIPGDPVDNGDDNATDREPDAR